MERVAVVFVHGFGSSRKAWNPLIKLLRTDSRFDGMPVDFLTFDYSTSLVLGTTVRNRTPSYRTVADKLRTRFARMTGEYDGLVFVAHSQGGLVVQTFLSRMLLDGRGGDLTPINKIILIACPNGGSGYALNTRRMLGPLLPAAQERRLRPLDEEIADVHQHVVRHIDRANSDRVNGDRVNGDRVNGEEASAAAAYAPPIIAFAAEDDIRVPRASAYGSFHRRGTLPGNHKTVIRPASHGDPGYLDLRHELLEALTPRRPDRTRRPDAEQAPDARHETDRPPAEAPEPAEAPRVLTNLPRRPGSTLIGRDDEIAALLRALREPGSITLIDGAAGAGKTSLALHTCHRLMGGGAGEPDAVIWLSARTTLLQSEGQAPAAVSISDLGDLTSTIALTLDRRDLVQLPPDQKAVAVAAALAGVRSVLVLDNFETIRDSKILPYLQELPQSCSIAITSRRRIDVASVIHLKPLGALHTRELVRLETTRRGLTPSDRVVSSIGELSGGVPLAVNWLVGRIAMGGPSLVDRVKTLDQDALLRYLFKDGVEQLAGSGSLLPLLVLAHPPGTVPSGLLTTALTDLGITDRESLDAITALRTLNLVEYDPAGDRYTVLPIIKRFLLERSAPEATQDPAVLGRIGEVYVKALTGYLDEESRMLWTTGYPHQRWDRDRMNTLTSVDLMIDAENWPAAARLMRAFYPFAITFGHFTEYLRLAGDVLARSDALSTAQIVELQGRRASILLHAGRFAEANEELAEAERTFSALDDHDEDLTNFMYFVRGVAAVSQGSPEAETILREAIEFERRRKVDWARIGFQGWLALHLVEVRRDAEAEALIFESLGECEVDRDFRSSVFLHVGLARLRNARAEHDLVIQTSEEVLEMAHRFGEKHNVAHLHLEIGRAHLERAQSEPARRHLESARSLYEQAGVVLGIAACDVLRDTLDGGRRDGG